MTTNEKDDTSRRVVQAIAELVIHNPGETATWYAERLGLKDATAVRAIIQHLVDAGVLPGAA